MTTTLYGADLAPARPRVRGLWGGATPSRPLTRRALAQAREMGRPLVATRSFVAFGEHVVRVQEGITRVAADHDLVRSHPDAWSLGPAPKRRERFEQRTGAQVVRLAVAPGQQDLAEAEQAPKAMGHFAVFDRWTEIDSFYEGRFLERISPGAFRATFENGSRKFLLEHGHDPMLGNKPIGEILEEREDGTGAWYVAELVDGLPPMLIDGLARSLYGASFRFRVMREEIVDDPGRSDHNPDNLQERTLKEVQVFEYGPVTFGAYGDATAKLKAAA